MDFVFLVPLPPHYIWRQTWDRRATEGQILRLNQIRDLDEARDYCVCVVMGNKLTLGEASFSIRDKQLHDVLTCNQILLVKKSWNLLNGDLDTLGGIVFRFSRSNRS
ncbi:hypothetical protein DPMN_046501 [Dreissena polymorpha]|uniref:Uncharacterized protein n=1 Tax=Dreissena polymorpha TaxID=45954 RepID=A0A9D4I2A0_DREPO|nr:hypothetical protein DPMN_046501 [Dreissena polymorpha]